MDMVRDFHDLNHLRETVSQQLLTGTKFGGMSYEEGILNVLDWLFDEDVENPME